MDLLTLLDAGPLGLACCDPAQAEAARCGSWLADLNAAGTVILIPVIAEYEVRRELLRAGAAVKLGRLEGLLRRFDRLDITAEALERAAEFRATLRKAGLPTAGPESLDADAILAGMAATCGRPGDSVVVATTNVKHLTRFPGVDARRWDAIA